MARARDDMQTAVLRSRTQQSLDQRWLHRTLLFRMQCLAASMKALSALLLLGVVACASAARPGPNPSSCPPLECHPSGPSFDYFKLVRCGSYSMNTSKQSQHRSSCSSCSGGGGISQADLLLMNFKATYWCHVVVPFPSLLEIPFVLALVKCH